MKRFWFLGCLVSIVAACGDDTSPQRPSGDTGSETRRDADTSRGGIDTDTGDTDAGDADGDTGETDRPPEKADIGDYCTDPPEYDDSGTYEVREPETSDHLHTSEHFAVRWDDGANVSLTDEKIAAGLKGLEKIWDFYVNTVQFPPPYDGESTKYKVDINLSDQGWATGSGTGEMHPEMWVHYDAYREEKVLAHEFAHTLQYSSKGLRDSDYVGWAWESHAEWMRHQYFPDDAGCAEALVNGPYLYYGSTRNRYCNWQFWEFLKEKYCYRVVNDMWEQAPEFDNPDRLQADPFSVIMDNLDWDLRRMNDEFGYWALHNATWDYDNGDVYARQFGSYDSRSGKRRRRVTPLVALDGDDNRYAVPSYFAPQRWGYNLVELHPTEGTETIDISFRGVLQEAPANTDFGPYNNTPDDVPDPHSGWRWGVVALQSDGTRRYSPLQRGERGQLSFEVSEEDEEIWLAVVGAPTEMHRIFWDQLYPTIYRYPWMVQLEGASPQSHRPDAPMPTEDGAPHANGGGWVDASASVADSAYVGPNAMVLGGTVSDNARIEDHAVVYSGTVSGNAVVGAGTLVDGGTVTDEARVETVYNVLNHQISGTAQVYGDMKLHTDLSGGVFYGFVDEEMSENPAWGAEATEPLEGVTQPGPYSWE